MLAPTLQLVLVPLLLAPAQEAEAQPAAEATEQPGEDEASPAAATEEPPPGDSQPEEPAASADTDESGPSEVEEPAEDEKLQNAGVAGNLVDKDDPNAKRATSDLEGESLGDAGVGVPDRMRPLQAGGWWSLFATTGLATAGGVFAGLAERQEDELVRMTQLVDLNTGSSYEYADVADQYEDMVDRGNKLSGAARGLFIASAVTAVASITLFAIDRKRQKERRVSFGPAAATVRF